MDVLNLLKLKIKVGLSHIIIKEIDKNTQYIFLSSFYKDKFQSTTPSKYNDKIVFHYSIPSYEENRKPEQVKALTIKSDKILIDDDVILFCKLNPSTPKIWKGCFAIFPVSTGYFLTNGSGDLSQPIPVACF